MQDQALRDAFDVAQGALPCSHPLTAAAIYTEHHAKTAARILGHSNHVTEPNKTGPWRWSIFRCDGRLAIRAATVRIRAAASRTRRGGWRSWPRNVGLNRVGERGEGAGRPRFSQEVEGSKKKKPRAVRRRG